MTTPDSQPVPSTATSDPLRILITGSAGFIGSHLVERFLNEGHTVIGVDNYISGQVSNTDLFRDHPRFTFIEADVSHGIPYEGEKLDWVMHFASPASPPHYQQFPVETLMVGAQGTQNGLELAHAHGAGFFLASTSEVYGDPHVHPQPETYWGNVNPIGVRSCYDEAKRYAEAITMAYHRSRGVNTRIIRIFNTYGPRMRIDDGRVVTNFIDQMINGQPLTIYGDGNQTRSFQYIDDLTESISRIMFNKYHYPINVGNDFEISMLKLVGLFEGIFESNAIIRYESLPKDDPSKRRPELSLFHSIVGKIDRIDFLDGVERTADHFKLLLNAEE